VGDLLLVDDEESVLFTMQAILAAAGHRTEAAGTRVAALALLGHGPFDVVVSDLHLDEGDGLQVIAEAKRRWPTTTGIILTGYGTFEAVTRALRAGVDDFLLKPTNVDDLKRSIERCVQNSRDAQRLHDYLYALVQHFAVSTITSILNFETAGNTIAGNGIQNAMSYLSDNVLLLTVDGEERTRRMLRILKTRGSAHDTRVREVEITAAGLSIVE
jgi:YesN/AraC family two-component response regulator